MTVSRYRKYPGRVYDYNFDPLHLLPTVPPKAIRPDAKRLRHLHRVNIITNKRIEKTQQKTA